MSAYTDCGGLPELCGGVCDGCIERESNSLARDLRRWNRRARLQAWLRVLLRLGASTVRFLSHAAPPGTLMVPPRSCPHCRHSTYSDCPCPDCGERHG